MLKMLSLGLAALLIAGCASYGAVVNEPLPARDAAKAYSIRGQNQIDSGDVTLILAFSGGGSRAAALAYGVLEELRDTRIMIEGRERPVIDEIDAISSVSGGSFTAAYSGLYGERIFDDFEDVFLRRDVQGSLIRGLLNPVVWFQSTGRTEMAVK